MLSTNFCSTRTTFGTISMNGALELSADTPRTSEQAADRKPSERKPLIKEGENFLVLFLGGQLVIFKF